MADRTGPVHRCSPVSICGGRPQPQPPARCSADCGSAHSVRIVLATVDQCPPGGAALHALKSSSETLGSFFTKATLVQIIWSATGGSSVPKLGMPVILMPFLIIQNTSWG